MQLRDHNESEQICGSCSLPGDKVDLNADVREHGGQHGITLCQCHHNRSSQPPVVTVWPPQLTLQTRPL